MEKLLVKYEPDSSQKGFGQKIYKFSDAVIVLNGGFLYNGRT